MKKNSYAPWLLAPVWIAFILDAKTAQLGAAEGIKLCIQAAIPSLFPFFFLSNLTLYALSGEDFGLLSKLSIPKGILLPAFLGGYPMGSSAVAALYRDKKLTKSQAENLLFYNQPGPAFLFGLVSKIFPKVQTIFLLWGIILFSTVLTAVIIHPAPVPNISARKKLSLQSTMQSSLQAMGKVCGWILLFRIIIEYLKKWAFPYCPTLVLIILTGILELTNGCLSLTVVKNEAVRFIICAGMLSFGGICVIMQTMSVSSPLSITPYLKAKLLQAFWAVLLSCSIFYPSVRLPIILLCTAIFLLRVDFCTHSRYNKAMKKEVTPCCSAKK